MQALLSSHWLDCYLPLRFALAACALAGRTLLSSTSHPAGRAPAPEDRLVSTLTKLALGVMGQLRPRPARGDARATIKLPAPDKRGGLPLMQALAKRRSSREFQRKPLPLPVLSDLLWAAFGVNRRGGGRTAPSAIDSQEIDVYVALPDGAEERLREMVATAEAPYRAAG